MTQITYETRMSAITSHFINIQNNNKNIKNIIYKYPNVLNNFLNRYNNLSDDVKQLCDFTENLQKLNMRLENTVSRVKSEYNELQKQLYECKRKLSRAEARVEQVSESSTESENICVICMTNTRECAYVTCGHVCACIECCERMGSQCPICRQDGNFIKLINV